MYREVTMIEIREVLRLRGAGLPKKRIAAQLGLDPKTVRRYLGAAATAGVPVTATIGDEAVRQVLLALHPAGGRPRGDGWARCVAQRTAIAVARRWPPSHQDSQAAGAAGRRDRLASPPEKEIEDLMNVRRIGYKNFQRLKPFVTVTVLKATEETRPSDLGEAVKPQRTQPGAA
jgi:hypothetical protein